MLFQHVYTPAGHCLQRERVPQRGPVRTFLSCSHPPVKFHGEKASPPLQCVSGIQSPGTAALPWGQDPPAGTRRVLTALASATAGSERRPRPSSLGDFLGPQSLSRRSHSLPMSPQVRALRLTEEPFPASVTAGPGAPRAVRPRRALAPSAGAPRDPQASSRAPQ